MHRRNVQNSNVSVDTRLCIHVAAFTRDFLTVVRLALVELVTREGLCQVLVLERSLRTTLIAEDDPSSVRVRRRVHVEPRKVRQNLSSDEVRLEVLAHDLGGFHIVDAVLDDLVPQFLRNRLVPGQTQFEMMDAELELPELQGVLLRGKVEDIRVRDVVSLTEHGTGSATDDLLGLLVQLLHGVTHVCSVEDMVVVPTAVESDKLHAHQLRDFCLGRVDHDDVLFARGILVAPHHHEEVREHLHVEDDLLLHVQRLLRLERVGNLAVGFRLFDFLDHLFRCELHVLHHLHGDNSLVGRQRSERQDAVTQIRHVVRLP